MDGRVGKWVMGGFGVGYRRRACLVLVVQEDGADEWESGLWGVDGVAGGLYYLSFRYGVSGQQGNRADGDAGSCVLHGDHGHRGLHRHPHGHHHPSREGLQGGAAP